MADRERHLTARRAGTVLAEYETALGRSPLSAPTRRVYRSRVAGFLDWLTSRTDGATALSRPAERNQAVHDYRIWLREHRNAQPSTINAALTALDHFYTHLQLGPAPTRREELASGARRVLNAAEQREFLRAVERDLPVRDRAIAHALFYAGLRVTELVTLDLPDLLLAEDRSLIVVGGSPPREVPIDPRPSLQDWLAERRRWKDAERSDAVFLNRRGGRLSSRSVDHLVVRAGASAGIEATVTPLVLRRTFAHRMLQQGTIEQVARLMGHSRLDTTRRYATPEAPDAVSR